VRRTWDDGCAKCRKLGLVFVGNGKMCCDIFLSCIKKEHCGKGFENKKKGHRLTKLHIYVTIHM
jgi:hypothetical protein